MAEPGEITLLLQRADRGEKEAAEQLFRMVEKELKAIASKRKQAVAPHRDITITGLVDEAFCRLVGQQATVWQAGDRRKFFSYAATKIHNLLVNMLKAEGAAKRGRGRQRVGAEVIDSLEGGTGPVDQLELLLDLQTALDEYVDFAEADAIIFRIRYFLNCTFEETAEIVGVSVTEAKRSFARSRLWLQRRLRSLHDEDDA
jgi:RNA polymerase sigma factor (TIGR02999 family)